MQKICYFRWVRTIDETRLANFLLLHKEATARIDADPSIKAKKAAVAEALGLSTVYLWQLLGGARSNIDTAFARKIEKSMNRDVGWLDTDFTLWPFPDIAPERMRALGPDRMLQIQGAVRKLIIDFEEEIDRARGGRREEYPPYQGARGRHVGH